jgi:hypothetical protein
MGRGGETERTWGYDAMLTTVFFTPAVSGRGR